MLLFFPPPDFLQKNIICVEGFVGNNALTRILYTKQKHFLTGFERSFFSSVEKMYGRGGVSVGLVQRPKSLVQV